MHLIGLEREAAIGPELVEQTEVIIPPFAYPTSRQKIIRESDEPARQVDALFDDVHVAFGDEVDAIRAEIDAMPIDPLAPITRLDNANVLKLVPMRAVRKESV